MAAASTRKKTSVSVENEKSGEAPARGDTSAPPLTPDEQYTVIRQASFLTDLKAKAQTVYEALTAAGATADTVTFAVDGVPVAIGFQGADVIVEVGDPAAPPDRALYTWQAPVEWLGITG